MINYRNVYLNKISHHLPDHKVTNQEIIEQNNLKIKSEWIEKRIGITERRWVDKGTAASDLAVEAIAKMNLSQCPGPIFLSTISSDYFTPSTSSIIKNKLGWKQDSNFAIDLNAACAGLIFALEQAALRMEYGIEQASLVIASETRSLWINPNDRRTVFLFADAASCLLLTSGKENTQFSAPIAQLIWTQTYTLSQGDPEILIPCGGSAQPMNIESFNNFEHCIFMRDGGGIVEKVEELMIDTIQRVLITRGELILNYDWLLFHQGNGQMIKKICTLINFPLEKTWINFNHYGNSSSSSIGVVLSELLSSQQIKTDEKILLVTMGAGAHLGLASLKTL